MHPALIALLGLGAVDLAVLNQWALPALLTVTDLSAATAPAAQGAPAPAAPKPAAERDPAPARAAAVDERAAPAARVSVARAELEPGAPDELEPDPNAPPSAVLLFNNGSWWIGPGSRKTLALVLEELLDSKHVIEVSGHADDSGADRLNQRVSEQRATAIARRLMQAGIAEERIRLRAYGEYRPSSDRNDRRVELRVGRTR